MSLSFCSVCGRPLRGDHCSLCFNRAQSNALKRQRHSTLTGTVVARKPPVVVDEVVADKVVPEVKSVPVKSVSADFYRRLKKAAVSEGTEPEITFSDPAADETTVVSGVDDDEVAFGSDAAAELSLTGVTSDGMEDLSANLLSDVEPTPDNDDPPMKLVADNLSSLFPLPLNEEADPAFDQGLDEIDEF